MEIVKEGKVLNVSPRVTGRKEVHMEDMSVFKSYLRSLLQDLKDLKEAIDNGEIDKASQMIDRLINDTQKGIEDN